MNHYFANPLKSSNIIFSASVVIDNLTMLGARSMRLLVFDRDWVNYYLFVMHTEFIHAITIARPRLAIFFLPQIFRSFVRSIHCILFGFTFSACYLLVIKPIVGWGVAISQIVALHSRIIIYEIMANNIFTGIFVFVIFENVNAVNLIHHFCIPFAVSIVSIWYLTLKLSI